ncbi:NAD(P)-dependent oxidoreductase [Anaeromyxobacter oryzisoli]|uniref:NAD(P)-dependent oxidoreductase n=1 Tax=Anaeromyxobacter oryzisoli TaxID=2925408 RepID=UPI001F584193|nr:NAD(P)-dependent oxidoreductase [Anaeromyxobacter sp. SG63]
MRIGFVGLGRMGSGMAARLVAAGHQLVVFNRTRGKAASLAARGAAIAEAPAEAARGVDALVTMLSDDAAVEEALFGGDGAARTLPRGAVHVSSSTISPELSARMAERHAAAGQRYVAAPVLGRPGIAERGELVVLAAGAPDALEASRPILDAIGKQVRVVGVEPPKANVVKLAANFVMAVTLEALGEAYALVESGGVDDATFLDVLNGAVLQSPFVEAYGKRIAGNAFAPAGFRLALGAKDVRLALQAAERAAVPMPLGSVLLYRFVAAIAGGHADEDWAAVGRVSTARRGTIV